MEQDPQKKDLQKYKKSLEEQLQAAMRQEIYNLLSELQKIAPSSKLQKLLQKSSKELRSDTDALNIEAQVDIQLNLDDEEELQSDTDTLNIETQVDIYTDLDDEEELPSDTDALNIEAQVDSQSDLDDHE
ncbi:hypothetical protein [Lihuaxuella thermophila]|uniref:Uncharacterized protein n=1 Tax=Lihuaxuella thermophila TaxID=1173111 RepID=A0A1H8DY92_9BACL|nr:hypothetical protein [Lihuaxuella thermophila]SEN11518.1 hypothetical protein SAMN05444955_1069 [Lihuaxuella thermophila]